MLRLFRLSFSSSVIKTLNPSIPKGKLSIVPTPIGNMQDISPNILKTLFKADLIGCEDRRIAGQLYHLIKNKNIINETVNYFGTFGLSNLIQSTEQEINLTPKEHQFYNYSEMTDKQRRRFLRQFTEQQQRQFKLQYLKYRANKILNPHNQFLHKGQKDKWDELYGLDITDFKHIQTQIYNTRIKKGRGILLALNTYSETKLFTMVNAMLENKHIAIVSDAGMPCISDPGWKLVAKIREKMPEVEVQVIGGPSSVAVMIMLASISSQNQSLSGRFEGFASLQPNMEDKTREMKRVKKEQFSINFINAKKMKKKVFQLQKQYGNNHNVMLANQLTKKYERRYNGTLSQLAQKLSNDKQFEPIGEVSYLLYPNSTSTKPQQNKKIQIEQGQPMDLKTITLSVESFLNAFDKSGAKMSLPEICQTVSAIFGVKKGEAKKIVYQVLGKRNTKL